MAVRLKLLVSVIAEFLRPGYRPERHYMRGPGPACERRSGTLSLS